MPLDLLVFIKFLHIFNFTSVGRFSYFCKELKMCIFVTYADTFSEKIIFRKTYLQIMILNPE